MSEYKKGLLTSIGCYVIWGLLPIYWNLLNPISSWVIIFYRIFLVCFCALLGCLLISKMSLKELFEPLKDKKTLLTYLAAGLIITVNWSTYIWAVQAGHIVQTSVGYYIEPIMICFFGIVFFKEKLTKYNAVAMGLALVSIVILLVHFKQIPGIALTLAITFSVYGAIKKNVTAPAMATLFYETMFLAPIALIVIIYLEVTGQGALAVAGAGKYALMLLCGIMTAVPLGMFSFAARRLEMFTLGLTQYISPTISLVLGVLVYNEALDSIQVLAFIITWIGLIFFSFGQYKSYKEGLLEASPDESSE